MKLKNKVAIVTGGSTGIGAATVKSYVEQGAKVYSLDLYIPQDVVENVSYVKCNVKEVDEIRKTFTTIANKEGRIDVAFLNAGVHQVGTIEDITPEIFDHVVNTNIKGVFFCIQEVVKHMKQNGGSIVLMGSDQCSVGKGGSSIYGLTKGAIGQLTKSTAIDFAEDNIRVNCVCPGTIDTPLYHKAVESFSAKTGANIDELYSAIKTAQPIQRVGRPEEVANAVLFLSSSDSSFVTGSLLSVDGGYIAQ